MQRGKNERVSAVISKPYPCLDGKPRLIAVNIVYKLKAIKRAGLYADTVAQCGCGMKTRCGRGNLRKLSLNCRHKLLANLHL